MEVAWVPAALVKAVPHGIGLQTAPQDGGNAGSESRPFEGVPILILRPFRGIPIVF